MVRRVLSLLLTLALFVVTEQSAAFAQRGPEPMQSEQMAMADCMQMMDQASAIEGGQPERHKNCTPTDCLNYMIACAGISAALPSSATPELLAYYRQATQRPGLENPMFGRSPPPDIQPPIA